jgi:hypothetical protein
VLPYQRRNQKRVEISSWQEERNRISVSGKTMQTARPDLYEMGKDFSWMDQSDYQQSIRYFVGNAVTNVHITTHVQRCFKKGPECYTDLPDGVSESYKLVYAEEFDI